MNRGHSLRHPTQAETTQVQQIRWEANVVSVPFLADLQLARLVGAVIRAALRPVHTDSERILADLRPTPTVLRRFPTASQHIQMVVFLMVSRPGLMDLPQFRMDFFLEMA